MPAHSLQDLVEQFSGVCGTSAPVLKAQPDGLLAFSTKVAGVEATVTQDRMADGDEAVVYIFFGPLPDDRQADALHGLLRTNMQMRSARAPSFALDAARQLVVLKCPYRLAAASGQGLLHGLQLLAEAALRWRENPFAPQAASPCGFMEWA